MKRNPISVLAALVGMALAWPTFGTIVLAAQAGPDQGLVVFTREDKFKGKAIRFNINVNGSPSLQLLAGSTIELPLPAGTHTFSVYSPSLDGQDSITINVQAGWTYYVEGYTLLGWPTGRPKFRFVSETPASASPSGPSSVSANAASDQGAANLSTLAGAALGSVATASTAGGQPERTAEERGRIGLRNFAGDWNLDMWSLAPDGTRLEGRGLANGVAEGAGAARIEITDFAAAAFPTATGGGRVLIAHEPGKGFTLESAFRHSGETLKFSGQYQAETGRYVFYQWGGAGGETATGVPRSSVRVEIRSLDVATWVADTYSSIDGQSVQVQSYRFTRR